MPPGKLVVRSSCGFAWIVFLGILVGCGGAENRPAKWSFIAPAIIEPNCATVSCHSAVAQRAGVVLDTKETGYKILTERHFVITCRGDATCLQTAADSSEIISLMRGQGSQRMPPDGALPDADIQLIATWITNGAQDD
jgi:hypothetical protein